MTRQEALNRVWKHFITDGNRIAYDKEEAACTYYAAQDGARCAVGCLLPKSVAKRLQSQCPGAIGTALYVEEGRAILAPFNLPDREFLERLQGAHDRSQFENPKNPRRQLKNSLKVIARDYNLKVPA